MTLYARLLLSAALAATALPAWAQAPRVVTDIPVVASLVQQVMGDLGQATPLLATGGDPHDYQLRPSQARSLQRADLLVWIGPGLTPWLERPAAELAGRGGALALLAQPGTHRQGFAEQGAQAAHDHDEDDHDHGDIDPHAWLDPDNGRLWLHVIAAALSERDPDHAAIYAANASSAGAEIAALDADLRTSLAGSRGKRFVVFHDAYGYFTGHYGLEPAIAVSLGDASTPSAARLRAIRHRIAAEGAACAFPETNHDPRLIAAVTEGSTLRSGAALDPEGSAAPPGAGLYAQILRGLAGALADCLSKG